MKWTMVFVLVVTPVIIASQDSQIRQRETASIRGQVYVDRMGMFLSEARVKVLLEGRTLREALSDEQGNYMIIGLRPGQYKISAEQSGFAEKQIDIDLKLDEQLLLNIGIQVGWFGEPPPPYHIRGVVRDSQAKPIRDTTITVISALDQQVISKGVTDAVGRYSVAVDYGNQLLILASKPGYATDIKAIHYKARLVNNQRLLDFVLEPLRFN